MRSALDGDLELLRQFYDKNKKTESEFKQAGILLKDFEEYLRKIGVDKPLSQIEYKTLDEYVSELIRTKRNTLENFLILLRYFHVISNQDNYIYLLRYLGGLDVLENIIARFRRLHGQTSKIEALQGYTLPLLGTSPQKLPEFVNELMDRLRTVLDDEEVAEVLAGNNHGVSKLAFVQDKLLYEQSADIDEFLVRLHQNKVEMLAKHAREHTVWFEQKIDDEAVEYVRGNQELLSAVRVGNELFVTKTPYDFHGYLHAKDPIEKRYQACHCPFARETIKSSKVDVPASWCNCSAGFTKFPFEVIFDKKLPVKVLASVLDGDEICRFAISLADVNYKLSP
ncbi:MAG: hypothetical protein JXB20_00670 [Bacilli bacterium]|nr:hypothetical protein [Bacilli bacterium]MBN2696011.1 hypothetical protein [Bacilli bacterium]